MLGNALFVGGLAAVLLPGLVLASRVLPRERWQILAAVPGRGPAGGDGFRPGLNLTYYGLLFASATVAGVALFYFLLAAVGLDLGAILFCVTVILALAIAASKLLAIAVEGKRNTFTTAGASFVGLLATPPVVLLYDRFLAGRFGAPLPLLPVLASLAIGYCFGEGLGRLACLSFGCCYGRPLAQLPEPLQKVFGGFSCTFHGKTKKIAYASSLDGVAVVPVQAMSALALVSCGLVALYLFLAGSYGLSFGLASVFAMGWRLFSERFRADYRGESKFTAYQKMSLANIGFCLVLSLVAAGGVPGRSADLALGLEALWRPGVLLFMQGLWVAIFLYTGVSRVTGARMSFHVHQDRI